MKRKEVNQYNSSFSCADTQVNVETQLPYLRNRVPYRINSCRISNIPRNIDINDALQTKPKD